MTEMFLGIPGTASGTKSTFCFYPQLDIPKLIRRRLPVRMPAWPAPSKNPVPVFASVPAPAPALVAQVFLESDLSPDLSPDLGPDSSPSQIQPTPSSSFLNYRAYKR